MPKEIAEVALRIDELKEMRRSTVGKKLSYDSRYSIANEIYDALLIDWAIDALRGRHGKGSGSLTYQLERARLEVEALEPKATEQTKKGVRRVVGWELFEDEGQADA